MFDLTPLYRSTIGFDRLARMLDDAASFEPPTYPPYNIERLGDNEYRITMAVAGFAKDEFKIEVKEATLVVSGDKKPEDKQRLLEENFGRESIEVRAYGNVLTAIAFLHNVAQEELKKSELEASDVPTGGSVVFEGRDLTKLTDDQIVAAVKKKGYTAVAA